MSSQKLVKRSFDLLLSGPNGKGDAPAKPQSARTIRTAKLIQKNKLPRTKKGLKAHKNLLKSYHSRGVASGNEEPEKVLSKEEIRQRNIDYLKQLGKVSASEMDARKKVLAKMAPAKAGKAMKKSKPVKESGFTFNMDDGDDSDDE